jgi:hypothetical protein
LEAAQALIDQDSVLSLQGLCSKRGVWCVVLPQNGDIDQTCNATCIALAVEFALKMKHSSVFMGFWILRFSMFVGQYTKSRVQIRSEKCCREQVSAVSSEFEMLGPYPRAPVVPRIVRSTCTKLNLEEGDSQATNFTESQDAAVMAFASLSIDSIDSKDICKPMTPPH